jgi:hypothetical protein
VSPTGLPRLGSVVWAKLEDANGFGRVRPVAVVTPAAEIAPGKPMRVVAITTRLPNPIGVNLRAQSEEMNAVFLRKSSRFSYDVALKLTPMLPNPLLDDHVLLPWDRQGKTRSGLGGRRGSDPVHAFELKDKRIRPRKKPFTGSDPLDVDLIGCW